MSTNVQFVNKFLGVPLSVNLRIPSGPPGQPLIGHLGIMAKDRLGFSNKIAAEYGDVVALRFANRRAININHPDLVHEVLVAQADKFIKPPVYKMVLARFLGNGLLTSDGEFWKRQRKLSQPAFHHKRILSYGDTMVQYADDLGKTWAQDPNRDVGRDMMHLTLRVVAKTLFNADISGAADRVGAALTELLETSDESMTGFFLALPEWIPTKINRRMKAAVRELDDIVMGYIEERHRSGNDYGDLLSMLMMAEDEDGSRMTDKAVRDEAVTIVLAGHETTANALTWAWYLLSQHPEVEEKLHEELDRVLGGRLPTVDDWKQLEYTQMVMKETMRLYPPIPSVGRQATEDLNIGGWLVKKDTIVMINPYALHHDARWFDNPEEFRPERFTKENMAKVPKMAYVPFVAGPRVCIGNMFAEMESALILATLAQGFRPQLTGSKPVAEATLTLRTKEPLKMRAEAREQIAVV